ncbi:MAG: hydrogenase maturation nickel metallochaperone HypA [Candidatus Omnitrophota bacterium]
MHEYVLAQDIVETIGRTLGENLPRLTDIHIEVGQFSSVVIESLEFGLQLILQEKNLPNVTIDISITPAFAICECQHVYQVQDILEGCPVCHSYNREMTSGKDVIIKSIEITE